MAAAQSQPPVSRVEAEVRRARALMEQRQFAPALALAQTLLAEVPENRDVLYLIAAGERYLGRIPEALRTLERLEALHPLYARLFQERGHCYRSLGNSAAAIAAYQRAVALNEALPASWKALQELLRAAGRNTEAEHAGALAEYLARLPPAIISASSLFAEGDVLNAEQIVRQFLQTHPDHIEGMRLLGRIGMKLDVLDDAEFLLESVLVFAPDYHAARYDYAEVLCQRHKYAQALKEAQRLRQWEPKNRNFRILYANACVGLGDHERALAMYRELLGDAPQNPQELHLSIAHALKTLGRQPEAIAAYRAAAAAQPSFGDAYWSLANLKTYRFTEEELTRMRAEEAQAGVSLIDRYHLCFALGKALEDRAAYAESFQYYERGNELKRTETRYKPGLLERDVRLQISVCTSGLFTARQGVGCARPDPIFIVGLPRAGSTLIEQILASHSRVEGTMELADIPRLVQHLNGRHHLDAPPRYPAVLPELTAEQLQRYGEKFIADTQVYRTDKPYFIDKMPNNFRHIGLIHLILPNAKIIDARREPMACCFSNFKQLFASGQEFTYGLEDIGRYYRAYVELMAHWDAVLPGTVLRVHHEELVEDLEHQVRRILDFVGLDFEPACLEFYKTERSIRTASSEQVRQPIYKEGIEQWRNFEPWLEPLKAALGELAAS
jgi:tetratricopeptide (TPR) repeat protein